MNAVDAAISVIHICKKSPNRNIVKSANTDVKYISLAPTVLVSTMPMLGGVPEEAIPSFICF